MRPGRGALPQASRHDKQDFNRRPPRRPSIVGGPKARSSEVASASDVNRPLNQQDQRVIARPEALAPLAKCPSEKSGGGGPARDFWCWEGGIAAAMREHRGKVPTLPAPKRPAGPTRETSRTDTKPLRATAVHCWSGDPPPSSVPAPCAHQPDGGHRSRRHQVDRR